MLAGTAISEAAAELGVTPSAISQAIRHLRRASVQRSSSAQRAVLASRSLTAWLRRQLSPIPKDCLGWKAVLDNMPGGSPFRAHDCRSRPPRRHSNADVRPAVAVAARISTTGPFAAESGNRPGNFRFPREETLPLGSMHSHGCCIPPARVEYASVQAALTSGVKATPKPCSRAQSREAPTGS